MTDRFRHAVCAAALLALAGCKDAPAPGWSGYAEGDYVYVAAPVAGRLQQLAVAAGEQVQGGAPLFTLDGQTERDAVRAAEGQLAAAQAQAANLVVVGVGRGGGAETRLSGRVEPMIDARAAVAASVGGRVERVLVAPGQSVRISQPLASLVSGDAATFRADADAAAAQSEVARQAYQRNSNLADQGVVARQEVEASRAQLLSAEAAARAARARSSAAGSPKRSETAL